MNMPSTPENRAQSVATPLCPVCHTVPLTGKQTVCSAKCRIQKSMKTRAAKQSERDTKIRLLLRTASETITEAKELLKEPTHTQLQGAAHHDDEP